MWVYLLATTEAARSSTRLTEWAEYVLQEFAFLIKIILEFIAILIIAIALVKAIRKFFYYQRRHQIQLFQSSVRMQLGLSLALSLEFLLAADIVGTAVSPEWSAIGKLAAITGIRTFLNFFLHREVQELQQIATSGSHQAVLRPEEFDSQ
jgi:uncharacterized membrane protein